MYCTRLAVRRVVVRRFCQGCVLQCCGKLEPGRVAECIMPPSRLLLLLLVAAGAASTQALVPPHFPRVFSASLEVTTKHLDKANVYPPAWRTIEVDYDFIQKRARAYVQTSYEKRQKTNGTTTLRRYDLGKEWEIAQFGKEMVCKWSRILNAKMPRPHLFDPDLQLDHEQVTRKVDGKDEKCLHWWQAGVDGSVRRKIRLHACACETDQNVTLTDVGFSQRTGHTFLRNGGHAHASPAGE